MKRLIARALLVAALLVHAGVARATDQDDLERRVGKYAVPSGSTQVKGVCVCQDGGPRHGLAGVLTWRQHDAAPPFNHDIYTECTVFTYDFVGQPQSAGVVCSPYVALAK